LLQTNGPARSSSARSRSSFHSRPPRPATRLRSGDLGFGSRLEAAKVSGLLFADLIYETYSPTFDLNDAGYLSSQNLHRFFGQLGFRLLDVGPARETRTAVELFGRNSWDAVPIARGVQLNNSTTWNNFWRTWLELRFYPPTFDNRETGDGARYQRPLLWGAEWFVTTNPPRAVVFETEDELETTWKRLSPSASSRSRFHRRSSG
jgi:hypothetical protein